MNKQLPEDIMSKIEQEANTYASKNCHGPEWGYDNHSDLETGYIAGRTASVQPLVDALRRLLGTVEALYDHIGSEGNISNDIEVEVARKVLSSFPSSPSNTGEDASEPDPDFTLWVVVNRWEYNEQYHKWFNGHITEFKYKHVTHSQLYQLFLEHKNKQQP